MDELHGKTVGIDSGGAAEPILILDPDDVDVLGLVLPFAWAAQTRRRHRCVTMTVADILSKHEVKLGSTTPGRHYTTCPHCSSTRSSSEHRGAKVLGVTIDSKGVRWGCNHCGWTGPEKGSGDRGNGKERNDLPTYVYRDADGAPRFRKVRNLPGREPRFWLERRMAVVDGSRERRASTPRSSIAPTR